MKKSEFEEKLMHLINCASQESKSDTPDFILAKYLVGCLDVYNKAVKRRDRWYGYTQPKPIIQ